MTTVARPATRWQSSKPANLKLQDLIECPHCDEAYVEPRLLPCQHSLCQPCVKQLKEGRLLECPVCGRTSSLKELKRDINKEQLVALCGANAGGGGHDVMVNDGVDADNELPAVAADDVGDDVAASELSEARDVVESLNSFGSTKANPAGSQPEIDEVGTAAKDAFLVMVSQHSEFVCLRFPINKKTTFTTRNSARHNYTALTTSITSKTFLIWVRLNITLENEHTHIDVRSQLIADQLCHT